MIVLLLVQVTQVPGPERVQSGVVGSSAVLVSGFM